MRIIGKVREMKGKMSKVKKTKRKSSESGANELCDHVLKYKDSKIYFYFKGRIQNGNSCYFHKMEGVLVKATNRTFLKFRL